MRKLIWVEIRAALQALDARIRLERRKYHRTSADYRLLSHELAKAHDLLTLIELLEEEGDNDGLRTRQSQN